VSEYTSNPQINASKMPVGSGIAGALVAISTMLIFLVGIPALRLFLLGAVVLGLAIFGLIRLARRIYPPKPPETISLALHEEHR
jgi:hypothetical protein